MVHHHPGTFFKPLDSRAFFYHLTAGFVARDNPLVPFGTLSQVFPVNGADIAAADSGRLGLNQHLAPARCGDRIIFKNSGAISGKECPFHGSLHINLLILGAFFKTRVGFERASPHIIIGLG
jgi:hypothetical protein